MRGNNRLITLAFCVLLTGMVPLWAGNAHAARSKTSTSTAAPMPVSSTTPSAQALSTVWYFAEGFTGAGFTTFLTLANPNAVGTMVQVKYLLGSGAPVTKSYSVNAYQRSTINVNTEVGSGKDVSLVVTASQPIVAERPMYFTFNNTIPGGTDTLGAPALGTSFYFGYLDTSAGYSTFLTILNQNSAAMTATMTYFSAAGVSYVRTHTVAANSRGTVALSSEGIPAGSYSGVVSLSAPGLVERPMYLIDRVTGYTGSADVLGVPAAQTDWYFAEGYTNSTFSERYILSNPGTTTAQVTVTLYRDSGAPVNVPTSIGPKQQQVININAVLGNNVNNSAWVHPTSPVNQALILAERFISFTYTSMSLPIPGASDTLGTVSPGEMFYFAEGYTGTLFAEWLTIENPGTQQAQVLISFLPDTGAVPTVQVYYVAPGSRFTLNTNKVMPNQSFSMMVQSSVEIVAERPMYFAFAGTQTGGSTVVGYQTAPPPLTTSCTPPAGVARVSSTEIAQWNNGKPQIALTFDAGGTDGVIATQILSILVKHHAQVTWFMTGQWALAHPDLLLQLRDSGMEVGNHTYDHPHLSGMTCQELYQADQVISDITGRTTRLFWRPPYGERDNIVRQMAATLGYRTIYWSIDTIDWDPNTTPQMIRDRVLNNVKNGSIVLMHAGSAVEAQTLDGLMATLEQRGFQMVMISQLIQG